MPQNVHHHLVVADLVVDDPRDLAHFDLAPVFIDLGFDLEPAASAVRLPNGRLVLVSLTDGVRAVTPLRDVPSVPRQRSVRP
jgi:hypothetical protein